MTDAVLGNVPIFVTKWASGSVGIDVPSWHMEKFKELIYRGANLWPDAPPAIKEFADRICNDGVVMQDYYQQAGVKAPQQPEPTGEKS